MAGPQTPPGSPAQFGLAATKSVAGVRLQLSVLGGPASVQIVQFKTFIGGYIIPPAFDPQAGPVVAGPPQKGEVAVPPGAAVDPLAPHGCCLTDWTSDGPLAGIWTDDGCPN